MPDIDIGQLTEAINDKADRDLNNTNATLPGLNAVLPNDMDYVVERQEPTAENNYTWYRLYKSGWIEQGGKIPKTTSSTSNTITLPIEMTGVEYDVLITSKADDDEYLTGKTLNVAKTLTKTYFIVVNNGWSNNYNGLKGFWQVSGMAAQE